MGAITKCATSLPVLFFILVQLVIFLPLALVRNIAKLGTAALIADVFILAGLLYIFGSEISIISKEGIAEIQMFNPRDFPLFIGYALVSRYVITATYSPSGLPSSPSKVLVWWVQVSSPFQSSPLSSI